MNKPERTAKMQMGNYEIESLIGHGGMASVYRAIVREDKPEFGLKKDDEVAIKILHAHLGRLPELAESFVAVAKAATQLVHANAARVFEGGVADDGTPYLVMEAARGTKLSDVLKEGKPLRAEQIISIMRQVSEALGAARERGITHGDIKPENVMLDDEGNIKVLDFGMPRDEKAAKLISAATSMVVESLSAPAYMAPERFREGGAEIDHRSDFYSLGVTAYQMATGRAPFRGPTCSAFARQHESEIPQPIEALNREMPKALVAIIERLMAKNPADRYQTAAELLFDLGGATRGEMPLRVYRFQKVRRIRVRRLAAIGLAAVIIVYAGVKVWYVVSGASMRRELRQTINKAQELTRAGDYAAVRELWRSIVAKYGRRAASEGFQKILEEDERLALTKEREMKAKARGKIEEGEGKRRMSVPEGFRAKEGTTAERYTKMGWAKEIVHEKTGIELLFIPAGTFVMGSARHEARRGIEEGPLHTVRIARSFYMGKCEVTQGKWKAVMGTNPSYFAGNDQLPVEHVSWDDCVEFLKKVDDGLGLPSEAEWEYACRGGTRTRYCFGDSEGDLRDYRWYNGNSLGTPHFIGEKKPNTVGLYDMHGNVWEWCQDCYHESYDGAPSDGSAWESADGGMRVVRGGGWNDYPLYCRSACRRGATPGHRSLNLGFRVALDIPE